MAAIGESGSFRDRSGHVFYWNDRVFRTVTEYGRAAYEASRDHPFILELERTGRIVKSWEVKEREPQRLAPLAAYLLEHSRIPFVCYPYEWGFVQLKAAALHHLDLQIDLLEHGFTLSDATAYNIQFHGPAPIFIDRLSIVPYVEGAHWLGHRQFCEQFLNPLLLRALVGIPHNEWYRGHLEGIPTGHLAKLVPWRHMLGWNVLAHVVLQDRVDNRALDAPGKALERADRAAALSRRGYEAILRQLRTWISRLKPKGRDASAWGDYAHENTYSDPEAAAKIQFVREFTDKVRPRTLIDFGCNTGDYSVAALESGADYAIGFDFDHNALDGAFVRAGTEHRNFLPLWLDAANPSPDQGWMQKERSGFAARAHADALLALAFEHHLAIAKNVPLDQVVGWLVGIAPEGIIEFVPKDDPTVQLMLKLRDDIFDDYDQSSFEHSLSSRGEIVRQERISASGRTLYWYSRAPK